MCLIIQNNQSLYRMKAGSMASSQVKLTQKRKQPRRSLNTLKCFCWSQYSPAFYLCGFNGKWSGSNHGGSMFTHPTYLVRFSRFLGSIFSIKHIFRGYFSLIHDSAVLLPSHTMFVPNVQFTVCTTLPR